MSHQYFQSMSLLEKGGGILALYYHIGNHWPSGVAVILSTQVWSLGFATVPITPCCFYFTKADYYCQTTSYLH